MKPTTAISAILIDVDGTLEPPKGTPTNLSHLLRIRQYVNQSASGTIPPIVISTGRNSSYVENALRNIGIPAVFPHIVEGGSALYDASTDRLIADPKCEGFMKLKIELLETAQELSNRFGCYVDMQKQFMISLYPGALREVKILLPIVQKAFMNFAELVDITHSSSAVDVTARGVDKGTGLDFWCTHTDVHPRNILAIGDGHNDIEMFLRAGYVACPGNAEQIVKDVVQKRGSKGFIADAHETAGVVQCLTHFTHVQLPDPRLVSIGTVVAIRQRQDMMCAKIPARNVQVTKRSVGIHIPDEPEIAITQEGFRALTEPSHGEFVRWGAGGLAPILTTKDGEFLVTLYRDAEASSWPNTLTVPTGLTADESEFVNIRHAMVREGVEEVLIKTPKGLLAPEFPYPYKKLVREIYNVSLKIAKRYWPDVTKLDPSTATPVSLKKEVTLRVTWGSHVSTQKCLVTIHNETNGIDAVKVVRYATPYPLHLLSLADGEESRNGVPLNRSIYLISLDEVRHWGKSGGVIHAAQSYKNGEACGKKTLTGIQPLPFLRDVMVALAHQ